MHPNSPKRCHHIRMNGTQCGSPAMRTDRFCFFHISTVPLNCEIKSYDLRPDENFMLPVLEDATSIQIAISQVMAFLLRGYIDVKKARVLLTACKLASHNLKRMDTEKPLPTQMLVDVETIPANPMGADLWSATREADSPSDGPSDGPSDASGDAPCGQPGVPQTQSAQPGGPQTQVMNQRQPSRPSRKDRRRTSEAAQREEAQAFGARLKESLERASKQVPNEPQADKSTGTFPPGAIQACQEKRKKEYVI
jgi:hypothetical protein